MNERQQALLELVRGPAALSVPGDVVAGAGAAAGIGAGIAASVGAGAGRGFDRRTAELAGASICLYWAGMAANDWADRALDAVERPERPIPSGRLSAGTAFGVATALTAAGLALAGHGGGRRAFAVAVPLAATIWAYDLRAKNTPAGPLVMSACRALDVLLGASTGHLARGLPPAFVVAVHTYTVTALSRREVSGSTARLPATTLATTAVLAGATAVIGPPAPTVTRTVTAALAAAYAALYGRAQARALSDPGPIRVRAAVGAGIVALPALQGALTARAGAPWAGLAVAAAAPAGRLLARKMSPT